MIVFAESMNAPACSFFCTGLYAHSLSEHHRRTGAGAANVRAPIFNQEHHQIIQEHHQIIQEPGKRCSRGYPGSSMAHRTFEGLLQVR